ncbi:N-acetylmuramoyl-L-alanine amidase family protein [Luteimonas sp. JM171]|uniref:N-acetylmuramoyl-L-alanine amidase family protein n=1 Tax=Luteimonas sp. JM171 TaxID=1896164 RepID=UPI000BA3F526|nr:N-acetylmuramoyl-L-alanine amidase [Luteimonas sp. JM171]
MVKVDPAVNRIAHREIKVRVWSNGRADDFFAGKTVIWSMEPLFVRPSSNDTSAGAPEFRGDWSQAADGHQNRFEPAVEFASENFTRLGQERASTTVDASGHTAIRVNLPPIGLNAARISARLESENSAINLIDLVVPGVIVIDPGHGGHTREGGSSFNNATSFGDSEGRRTLEKDLALIFGRKLQKSVERQAQDLSYPLRVIMTRDEDINVGIADRATFSAKYGADIFISIHFNGNDRSAVHGPETLIESSDDGNVNFDQDMALAQRIQAALTATVPNAQQVGERGYRGVKIYSPPPSGVYRDRNLGNIAGLPNSRACLAEIDFITNPDVELELISGPRAAQNQDAVVEALAEALLSDMLNQP